MDLTTRTEDLEEFCNNVRAKSSYVSVDTEFIREETYWPILCLIQLGIPGHSLLIDPTGHSLSLDPLKDLFLDKSIVKVFHSGRQDLEIFYHLWGLFPAPLFDTQVGAMACGFPDSVSFERLVRDLVGESLDKSQAHTRWDSRPLSHQQIQYALNDVVYLCPVYEILRDQLNLTHRRPWIEDDMVWLVDPENYDPNPMDLWKKISIKTQNPQVLSRLQHLCVARNEFGRNHNRSRNRLMKDQVLVDIALRNPQNLESLKGITGVSTDEKNEGFLNSLMTSLEHAWQVSPEDFSSYNSYSPQPEHFKTHLEVLQLMLREKAQNLGIAEKLLATRRDLEKIIMKGPDTHSPLFQGWRLDVLGHDILNYLQEKKNETKGRILDQHGLIPSTNGTGD
jgi:ribonuclease D